MFTNYFHAISLDDKTTDIFQFDPGPGVVNIQYRDKYPPYDVVKKIVDPLVAANILRPDGKKLLIPLEGSLSLPDTMPDTKLPLLFIFHGNFPGYVSIVYEDINPGDALGTVTIKDFTNQPPTVPPTEPQVLSYTGYVAFQKHLAEQGIASYSINLNMVNGFENNEGDEFKQLALDCNQRIFLFFLHLKLLKLIAGESLSIGATDKFPIKLSMGSSWLNLSDALNNPASNAELISLKNKLIGKIDFTKIGLMGHSRGADAVCRIPAYFFKGTSLPGPTFDVNVTVDTAIKTLCGQVGNPDQNLIKSILALQPSATANKAKPAVHGYIIDSPETMFFLGVGTHDEDVSFDVVRMYEHPQCSKAMVAINGAAHKWFNREWEKSLKRKRFGDKEQQSLLTETEHRTILDQVFGRCFTSTLTNKTADLKCFSKQDDFPVKLPRAFDLQQAWKFGFPIHTANTTLNELDSKLSGIVPESELASHDSFSFEQHLKAFYVEKTNEGNFIIKLPIDPNGVEKLANYTHFSFRFAKGYKLSPDPDRKEEKNFTIQLFEGDSAVGKLINGSDITTIELKALWATPVQNTPDDKPLVFEHSILLQTVEINLDRFDNSELTRANRIEITIIPDKTKDTPPSKGKVIGGSALGGAIGGVIGFGGSIILCSNDDLIEKIKSELSLEDDKEEELKAAIIIGSGLGLTALGTWIGYKIVQADKNAFVFKDFLLTKRQLS